jgi:hypothetical protein
MLNAPIMAWISAAGAEILNQNINTCKNDNSYSKT